MVASLVILAIAFFWWKGRKEGKDVSAKQEQVAESHVNLADGSYVYEGVWDDGGRSPQSCRMLFTKDNGQLKYCSYTNIKYSTTTQLTGEMRGDSLYFKGKIGTEDLLIVLAPGKGDDKELSGTGSDYAHNDHNIRMKLFPIDVNNMQTTSSDNVIQESTVIDDTPVSSSRSYSFSGSIDRYSLWMDLTIDGSDVSGSYYYISSGSGERLYLRGTLFSDGEMVLTETTSNGIQTGRFDGNFDGSSYNGHFKNYKEELMYFTLIAQ